MRSPNQTFVLLILTGYLLQVANSQVMRCYQFHEMGSVGVHLMKTLQLFLHVYGIHCV